jgi:hypothetical protein
VKQKPKNLKQFWRASRRLTRQPGRLDEVHWNYHIPNNETAVISVARELKQVEERGMKQTTAFLIVIGLFSFAVLSYASDRDDAKSLVKRAAAYVKYQGKEKALAEISKPKGMFDKG